MKSFTVNHSQYVDSSFSMIKNWKQDIIKKLEKMALILHKLANIMCSIYGQRKGTADLEFAYGECLTAKVSFNSKVSSNKCISHDFNVSEHSNIFI